MTFRINKKLLKLGLPLLVIVAILSGPVATWQHGSELRPPPGLVPDCIYLVAGERDMGYRMKSLVKYATELRVAHPGATGLMLAGCNKTIGRYSREDGRNLSVCEWAVKDLTRTLRESEGPAATRPGGRKSAVGYTAADDSWEQPAITRTAEAKRKIAENGWDMTVPPHPVTPANRLAD